MSQDVTSDSGYFAMVPEWVIDTASANAVKIYGLLRRYADKESLDAYPSRRKLARRMGFSRPASVDPAIAELVRLGAVRVTPRRNAAGDQDSNAYLLITVPPAHIVRVEVEKDFFMWVVRESAPPRTQNRTGGSTPQRTTGGTRKRTTVVRESGHEPESLEPESEEPETGTAPAAPALPAPIVLTEPTVDEAFDALWEVWPRKVHRKEARRRYTVALLRIGGSRRSASTTLIRAAEAWTLIWTEVEQRPIGKIPQLDSWLEGERWTDEIPDLSAYRTSTPARPAAPAAPNPRNGHCEHGYWPGARMPDGSIERCPHDDCARNEAVR